MNNQEKQTARMIQATRTTQDRNSFRKMQKKKDRNIYTPIAIAFIIVIWFIAAHIINQPFIFPSIERDRKSVV